MKTYTIDKKQVICKNASLIGYGTNRVRVGALFTYVDKTVDGDVVARHTARMVGRVTDNATHNGKRITGWIYAMVLADCGTFAYIRWVDPDDVTRAENEGESMRNFAAFGAFFFGKLPADPHATEYLLEQGVACASYIHHHLAPALAEFKARGVKS